MFRSANSTECDDVDSTCCSYLDKRGKPRWAQQGQMYFDGCNSCTCINRTLKLCTLQWCPDTCSLMSWEGVFGHVTPGRRKLKVLKEGSGCKRKCKCVRKGGGVRLSCYKKCH